MIDKLLEKLQKLTEDEFIDDVLSVLIPILHPGRIEYTHSNIEAGRDIISIGKDTLGRPHILCIQAKSKKISYGSDFIKTVYSQSKQAKFEEVTLGNGDKVKANEVWFINTFPFGEHKRRQVSGTLKEMENDNLKFIAGEEVSEIINNNSEHLVNYLLGENEKNIKDISNKLLQHKDSRAFNLSKDKKINDLFVDISLCPTSHKANYALNNKIKFEDKTLELIAKGELLDIDEPTNEDIIKCLIVDYSSIKAHIIKLCKNYNIELSFRVLNELGIIKTQRSKDDRIQILLDFSIKKEIVRLVLEMKEKIRNCPKKISDNIIELKIIISRLQDLETIISIYHQLFGFSFNDEQEASYEDISLSIFVDDILLLLELSDKLIIEGIPGIGKSTILKKLSSLALNSDHKLVFIPCFQLPIDKKYNTIDDILLHNAYMEKCSNWNNKDIILVFDGLDETSIELSEIISKDMNKYSKIITTTRIAHEVKLRSDFTTILLSPLSENSRDQFFNKWFINRPDMLKNAQYLYNNFSDIDRHSKIPLLATILASLIEHNYTPRTRLEIYENRIELLLWKWDKSRGVNRINIENPTAKKRFLETLAYEMHCDNSRIRLVSKDKMLETFVSSLGNVGYKLDFDKIVEDLTLHSGILIEEFKNTYSFGHLSFQEYLVGKYIFNKKSIKQISLLLENDWWLEPLKFYSAIAGDLTELINYLIENDLIYTNIKVIKILVEYAVYTTPGAIDIVNDTNEISYEEV